MGPYSLTTGLNFVDKPPTYWGDPGISVASTAHCTRAGRHFFDVAGSLIGNAYENVFGCNIGESAGRSGIPAVAAVEAGGTERSVGEPDDG